VRLRRKEMITPYERVQLARSKERMVITDYVDGLLDDFVELKGDRLSGEDNSILGGIGTFEGIPVTVIGHRKGKSTEDNVECNFGMTSPEGYRKALRLMRQAEKFHRPVITFIDTPGAYPGMEAEMRGQANAIAENIAAMSTLRTPIISIVTGEGSSGGALAIGVADSVWMLENSVYSILSPEGFASILWKDAKRAKEASEIMKITPEDLLGFGFIDGIIPEGKNLMKNIRRMLAGELKRLMAVKENTLVSGRYRRYRNIDGAYAPERG
jgi:acetyl-CoA carboxylase carboxyl transferase subunit alpha